MIFLAPIAVAGYLYWKDEQKKKQEAEAAGSKESVNETESVEPTKNDDTASATSDVNSKLLKTDSSMTASQSSLDSSEHSFPTSDEDESETGEGDTAAPVSEGEQTCSSIIIAGGRQADNPVILIEGQDPANDKIISRTVVEEEEFRTFNVVKGCDSSEKEASELPLNQEKTCSILNESDENDSSKITMMSCQVDEIKSFLPPSQSSSINCNRTEPCETEGPFAAFRRFVDEKRQELQAKHDGYQARHVKLQQSRLAGNQLSQDLKAKQYYERPESIFPIPPVQTSSASDSLLSCKEQNIAMSRIEQ